jgi:predicted RND superfamily exporter protein
MAADLPSIFMKQMFRWRVVLIAALLVATVVGLTRIRVGANVLDLLPQDLVAVRGLKIFLGHFGQPHELIVMVEASDAAEASALVDSLADDLRATSTLTVHSAPPWAADPRELVPLAAYALLNQAPDKFHTTLEKLSSAGASSRASDAVERLGTTMAPEEIARLAYDPLDLLSALPSTATPDLANCEFSSLDARTRLLYVTPVSRTPSKDWVAQTTNRIQDWQSASPGRMAARVGWTGEPAFVQEISSAMEEDMQWSSISSLAFAALIFFLAHRRLRPLWGLLFYVSCSFAIALGLTALVFPGLSIISVGFAAILAGLTVDYGFILYQRRIEHGGTLQELRAATSPGILAGAVTTAAAFLSLNLSGLPGIAQLGTTVAIGVLAGALLMIFFYARALHKMPLPAPGPVRPMPRHLLFAGKACALLVLLTAACTLVFLGFPQWTADTNSMRPRESVAYPTLDRLGLALGNDHEVLNVIISSPSESIVSEKLILARASLTQALQEGLLSSFELPDTLWPRAEFLKTNLASAAAATSQKQQLGELLTDAGFSEAGTFLTDGLLDQWQAWQASSTSPLPENAAFHWIARRTMSLGGPEFAACGVAIESGKNPAAVTALINTLAAQGIYLTGWHKLGEALSQHALGHGMLAGAAFLAVLFGALFLSLRNLRDTLLVLGITGLSLLAMTGLMRLFSLEWNFLNLCSVTLTIGAGVDYSIHMIFALRQNNGDHAAAFRDVGKALGLCAATTVVGFGSLATAQTIGLASLGINCALGVALNALFALFLLPWMWRAARVEISHGALQAGEGC